MRKAKINMVLAALLCLGVVTDCVPGIDLTAKVMAEEVVCKDGTVMDGDEIVSVDETKIIHKSKRSNSEDVVTTVIKENGQERKIEYAKDQIMFMSKPGVSFKEVRDIIKKDNGRIVSYDSPFRADDEGFYVVEYPNSSIVDLFIQIGRLEREEKIEYPSLNYIAHCD